MFAGRRVLVVGGTRGIGRAIAMGLWRYGAEQVTFTGRHNPAEASSSSTQFLTNAPTYLYSDLGTVRGCVQFAQQRDFASEFDTVVFCQGTTSTRTLQRNAEGIEQDFCTSYLSRFALLQQFLNTKKHKKPRRLQSVYVFGFPGVEYRPMKNMADLNFVSTKYSQYDAHYNTIVCNECLVYETKRRHPDLQVVIGLNPGIVPTELRANSYGGKDTLLGRSSELLVRLFNPSADQYVERSVLPLMSNDGQRLLLKSPMCYSNKGKELPPSGWLAHEENRSWVWDVSEHMVKRALDQSVTVE